MFMKYSGMRNTKSVFVSYIFAVFKSSFAPWAPILTALPVGILFKKIASVLTLATKRFALKSKNL